LLFTVIEEPLCSLEYVRKKVIPWYSLHNMDCARIWNVLVKSDSPAYDSDDALAAREGVIHASPGVMHGRGDSPLP
jgi:hypothetical protein